MWNPLTGGLGSVVGLLLGGTLTEYLGWRYVLFINVPIAVAVLIGTGVLAEGDRDHGALDIPGAAAVTLGIGSFVYAIHSGSMHGWSEAGTIVFLAIGAGLLIAFPMIERSARAPMMPAGTAQTATSPTTEGSPPDARTRRCVMITASVMPITYISP